jgi:hypothetical protein
MALENERSFRKRTIVFLAKYQIVVKLYFFACPGPRLVQFPGCPAYRQSKRCWLNTILWTLSLALLHSSTWYGFLFTITAASWQAGYCAWLVIGNQRAVENEWLLRQCGEALPLTYERR